VVLFGLRINKKTICKRKGITKKNPGGNDMFLVIDKLKIVKNADVVKVPQ
jgi:hypothetical protein